MIQLSDIISDSQIAILRQLEVVNESHLCRVIIAEKFHQGILEGKTWSEMMDQLGNQVWDIAGKNYCFDGGTIKKFYSWYKKKIPNL